MEELRVSGKAAGFRKALFVCYVVPVSLVDCVTPMDRAKPLATKPRT